MASVPRIAFATLGCKTNQAETVRLVSQLAWDLAVVPFDSAADIYVVNTCTVTREADRQSRQLLRRAHRANPDAAIVVAGCAADYAGPDFADLPGVQLVAPNDRKDTIASQVAAWYGLRLSPLKLLGPGDRATSGPGAALAEVVTTRAWLKISEGCDNACAYCVIPRVRGVNRSRPARDLTGEARALVEAGYREIVLTGTNIGSYGQDGGSGLESRARGTMRGSTLAPLLRGLVESAPARWRIGSIEPLEFPEDLVDAFADERICPHLHLCLQSGSDRILARMRRRYDTSRFAALVDRFRAIRPDLAITTDVIVGFPGETEPDFEDTLSFLRHIDFSGVHLFPYSDRDGTAASGLDGHVGSAIIAERMERGQGVAGELQTAFYRSWLGRTVDALVERVGPDFATATTPHNLKLRLAPEGLRSNTLVRAIVEGVADGRAEARLAD